MLLYNKLTELTVLQLFPALTLLLLGLILGIVLLKIKPSLKIVILSLILGVLVSLVSSIVGWGNLSRDTFSVRLGWPIQFFNVFLVSKEYNRVHLIDTPSSSVFDLLRFGVNTLTYSLSFLNILWFFSIRKIQKNLRVHVLLLFTLFALLIISSLSLYNKYVTGIETTVTKVEDDTEQKLEPRARYLVETKYPEFKDFEKQQSFAGKVVIPKVVGSTVYLAYAVEGSGVRYVDVTCFIVGEDGVVKENGKYSPLSSSNMNDIEADIDPVKCSN